MAVVTVANTSGTTDYTNRVLTHIIPAGWEIFNERMTGQISNFLLLIAIRDIRDDRILTYFTCNRKPKHLPSGCRHAESGDFVMPAIQCESDARCQCTGKDTGRQN